MMNPERKLELEVFALALAVRLALGGEGYRVARRALFGPGRSPATTRWPPTCSRAKASRWIVWGGLSAIRSRPSPCVRSSAPPAHPPGRHLRGFRPSLCRGPRRDGPAERWRPASWPRIARRLFGTRGGREKEEKRIGQDKQDSQDSARKESRFILSVHPVNPVRPSSLPARPCPPWP